MLVLLVYNSSSILVYALLPAASQYMCMSCLYWDARLVRWRLAAYKGQGFQLKGRLILSEVLSSTSP